MAATIIAAIDDSPAAAQVVRLLAGYQGDREAVSVVLLGVQPPAGSRLRGADLRSLEEARDLVAGAGLAVETALRTGAPADEIVRAAAGRDAAMIVIGTRGHGALRGYALGSVALRVAHGSPAPVMLVRPDTRLPAALGRGARALVALDGSPTATRTVAALLAREAWLGRVEFELVHVRPAPALADRLVSPEQALLDQWGTLEAEEATRDARALLYKAGRAWRTHEPRGDTALEVPGLAQELRADLVAMGTRALGALHHAVLGSEALKVAVRSPVPVMLAP
jgi:nucleotide-binding universal stress UspA family protein